MLSVVGEFGETFVLAFHTCNRILSGQLSMTRFFVCAIPFVFVPKIGISIVMSWYGAKFIALSVSLEDLILNSLALNFITDVDNVGSTTFEEY